MPYDEEGNFVYPTPRRRGKTGNRPASAASTAIPPKALPTQSAAALPSSANTESKKFASSPTAEPLPFPAKLTPLSAPPAAPVKPTSTQAQVRAASEAQPAVSNPSNSATHTNSPSLSTSSTLPRPTSTPAPFVFPASEIGPVYTVQEGANRWQMSEADLALVWNAQSWPHGFKLVTGDRRSVEVIYRGRWSGGFGPDFKGAILRLGPELVKGDVELHLRSGDWRLHGHHQDTRYNRVVLQVVLEDNEPTETEGGASLPVLALLPLFQTAGTTLAATLTAARSSGTRLGTVSESVGPCCGRDPATEALPGDLPALLARLDDLGDRRFEERVSRFEAACAADPDASPTGAAQELWVGLLEALGYSQNKEPFRRLAQTLPLTALVELDREARRQRESGEERLLSLEAVLLGGAGLLPSQRKLRPAARRMAEASSPTGANAEDLEDYGAASYIEELERRWEWLRRHLGQIVGSWQPLTESDWTLARLRPPNHPARRLAGLARLLVRWEADEPADLLEELTLIARAEPQSAAGRLGEFFRVELSGQAQSESAAFWARRYDFSDRAIMAGQNARGATADLIGADRAADIVINIALPFLAGYSRDRRLPGLDERATAVYRAHPRLGSNELIENVARQVFRYWLDHPQETPDGKVSLARLVAGARRQQGLIYLHHHFCAEQDFGACPLL